MEKRAFKDLLRHLENTLEIAQIISPKDDYPIGALNLRKRFLLKIYFLSNLVRLIRHYFQSGNIIISSLEICEEETVSFAAPTVREIFEKALQCQATFLICVHNQPSGDPSPSPQDKKFTRQLVVAGSVLQINVLDHIIIGQEGWYSFADAGLI